MLPRLFLGLVLLLGLGAGYAAAHAPSGGARAGYSGAPREGATPGLEETCATCHSGGAADLVSISAPASYTPGTPVSLQISGVRGFQVTVRDPNDAFVGAFSAGSGTRVPGDRSGFTASHYLTHSAPGSSWTVEWTPPSTDVGPVTVHVAGVGTGSGTSTPHDTESRTLTFMAGTAGEGGAPTAFALRAASANPSRGALALALDVPVVADVALAVFDARGRQVRTRTARLSGVDQRVEVPDLAAGVYVVRATALVGGDRETASGRFVVVE